MSGRDLDLAHAFAGVLSGKEFGDLKIVVGDKIQYDENTDTMMLPGVPFGDIPEELKEDMRAFLAHESIGERGHSTWKPSEYKHDPLLRQVINGMNDARMKILEGLLRLRQLCNHPRLVDAKFKGPSGKFELLLDTLDTLRAEGHRALVFSQFVQMLSLVREALDARGIPYAYLDGQTRDRQRVVDSFQNDDALPFFLISLKAGGVGLNLTAADYVIHIDPWWNPAVEMQATDRTHRIGQDKPVFVYKLVVKDSVEEKILQLQEHKRELVEQVIGAEGGVFKSLTREDVEVLFT